ncbi:DNA repair protein Nse1 [Zopfia rhizophila CBS 207.26]|uniref:Non-structural maintenance of chromosomes element 1 homolog n=1 Tax=Zopfia rhizophila CBS 207.26 TaxID=1314779 RepID=A0A6A6ELD9_9PEZI|nr:DNA repair protein Nse1 [Zopfia rhizophila CBS 207.26]
MAYDPDPSPRPDLDDTGAYNNSHRAFLQAFLSHSVLTADEIKPILAAVLSAHEGRPMLEGDITAPDISQYVTAVNSRLSSLDLEIRSTRSQTDRTLIYALVNTTSDPLTQLATTRTPDEISYVKRVLDAMFETNNTRSREIMAVSSVEAANLAKVGRNRQSNANEDGEEASQAKNLSLNEAEKVLQECVEEGWFLRSRAGYYSLAPRALMELRALLKETYNEPPDPEDAEDEGVTRIRDCEGCREIVTVGQRCSDRECGCRLHDHCTQQFFRNQTGERKCPKCKEEWTGNSFVGEKVVTRTRPSGRGSGAGPSRRTDETADLED